VLSGDKLLVVHEIKAAYVIKELNPKFVIRANRTGIRSMVRVVLPHSIDPENPTAGPLTLLLGGPVYRDANRFRRLSFAGADIDIDRALTKKLPFLRTKYGRAVSTRDAYVDQLVLDLVPGTGDVTVWIDDVEIDGVVSVPDEITRRTNIKRIFDRNVKPTVFDAAVEQATRPDIRLDGTVIEIGGRPFAARIVEHNGESLEFLSQLGFNVVKLASVPSPQQSMTAARLRIWLIAPPPEQVGLNPLERAYDRVLAWHLGANLKSEDLERTRALVREIRHSDPWKDRPLVAEVASNWEEFARIADILVNGFEPIGGSFVLNQYSDWLRQRNDLAGRAMPTWAVVQSEYPAAINSQVSAIANRVPPLPIEPFQVQSMVYETLASGTRGHWFRSRTRMDGGDPQSQLRAITVRWINAQVRQMEPWIAGGAVLRNLDSKQQEAEVTTIKTSRSRLLLVQRPTYMEQWVAGTPLPKTVLINNPSASSADQVFRLSESNLQPLNRSRQLNSSQIRIDDCPSNVAIVMTQEPLVIRSLVDATQQTGNDSMLQMHIELTRRWLVLSQIVSDQLQRSGNGLAEVSGATNEATNLMQQVSALVASGSASSAVNYLQRADQRLAIARQAIIMRGRRSFANATACPLFASMTSMPSYWELTQRLDDVDWQPNGLAGGEFEDLAQLTAAGWDNVRSSNPAVETLVELNHEAARQGNSGLLMSASSKLDVVDERPLLIRSGKVKVKAGQLVRIHGWVNITQPLRGNLDGFMIFDSLGGRDLAERITVTRGWQQFSIFRGVNEDTDLQVTFALTGLGKVLLDEVTIRAITPRTVSRQALREDAESDLD